MGREIVTRPSCPFCGLPVDRPKEPDTRRPGEMPVGSCSCGAVYACDETGHSVGSAMIEALVFACDMDWDLAWNLQPEEDFQQEIVENYDYVNHLIVPGGFFESRRIWGVLLFIRLHEEVQEVTGEAVRKRVEKAKSLSASSGYKRTGVGSLTKKEIQRLVEDYQVEPILLAAQEDNRILNKIQRLLYTPDDLLRMRAADILGQAASVIAERDPGVISKLLQNLLYAVSDTAASSWGAFDAVGEIIRRRMELFAGYVPQLYQYLSDENRRAPVLQILSKAAESRPDLLRKIAFHIIPMLSDPDARIRGYAASFLGNAGAKEAKEDLEKLQEDPEQIDLYENGAMEKKSVGEMASESLGKLGG